jgi:hypothetical protein
VGIGAIQKPLVLTFYGILISEMSFRDKVVAVPNKHGDFEAGDRKGTFDEDSRDVRFP